MFISQISITNFRLFRNSASIQLNVPDGQTKGSGITVLVGENSCGKTTILDAIAFPLLAYKAETFAVEDLNNHNEKSKIEILSSAPFEVSGTMPNNSFLSKGMLFEGGFRSRTNKAFLSSLVTFDQQFIPVNPEKPKKGSPDLRITVNNPFSGPRFNENDVIYLDKNRTRQTHTGSFSETRFDRLMEDFSYQYDKQMKNGVEDLMGKFGNEIKQKTNNDFLVKAIADFRNISGTQLSLNLIDNWHPFKNAFFANKVADNKLVPISKMGSGYEMMLALMFSYYLAEQSGKQLIILIDEPEIHLHPRLQAQFMDFLINISDKSQIVITSHSPLLVKQLMTNDKVLFLMCRREQDGTPVIDNVGKRVLPYISANEVNYLAFNLSTPELHNELYGYLQSIAMDENVDYEKEKEFDKWLQNHSLPFSKKWSRIYRGEVKPGYDCTLQTFIRNSIHHPENRGNNEPYTEEELSNSIKEMINVIHAVVG